ncbi:MAG: RagB/SusD family nutrient uptake outer membrane protein [Candidatus Cryptobacteroides sp.]
MMNWIKHILMTAAALTVVSCNLDFDPTWQYSATTFWYSASNADGGLTACYLPLRNGSMWGGAALAYEECATPNAYNYSNSSNWNDLAKGTHTSDGAIFANRWTDCYIGIGRCNLLIENIGNNKELTSTEINRMLGQARFLRALYYSVLSTYYYSAPLITGSPDISQTYAGRADRAELIDFIVSELDAAAELLPRSWTDQADLGRATSGAALALKSRVLLFEASPLCNSDNDIEAWKKAADAAKAVMDLGIYSLYPDYSKLFTESAEHSSEYIFNIEAVSSPTGNGHSLDVTMRQYNSAAPLKNLVDCYRMKDGKPRAESRYFASASYMDLDPRFYATIVYPGSTWMGEVVKTDNTNTRFTNKQTGFIYKKYTVYGASVPTSDQLNLKDLCSPVNIMLLRYADVLLQYAEAMNESSQMDASVWNKTVKLIRQRAGFTESSALDYPGTYEAVRDAIIYERQIEFAGEGTWYNDMRRLRLCEKLMDGIEICNSEGVVIGNRNFSADRDYWWPVPANQIELDKNLAPNNPGW